jgi:hypothetical protein
MHMGGVDRRGTFTIGIWTRGNIEEIGNKTTGHTGHWCTKQKQAASVQLN